MGMTDRHSIASSISSAVTPMPKSSAFASKPALSAIRGGAANKTDVADEQSAFSGKEWLESGVARHILGTISIGSVLLVWYLATRYQWDFYIRFANIPTPADVWDKVREVNQSSKFILNVGISVRRVLIGFSLASVVGIFLGILIGR